MIVACPMCSSKYSVQAEAIGSGKMVRCTACGMTWQQAAVDSSLEKKQRVWDLIKWTFFWFAASVSVFSLFFAKSSLIQIWPSVVDFYDVVGMRTDSSRKSLIVQNISNFFLHRDGKMYMGLKGELFNTSDEVQTLPSIIISLKDDTKIVPKKEPGDRYKKIWTHNLTYKKLLPNQKVVFETELQSVPCNNLICEIKLDAL